MKNLPERWKQVDPNTRVIRFNNVLDAAVYMADSNNRQESPYHDEAESQNWCGGGVAEGLQWLQFGCPETHEPQQLQSMDEYIREIKSTIEQKLPRYQNHVAGAFPNVPDFLNGRPDCMRRKSHVDLVDLAPVTIYIDLAVSAGVKQEIANRKNMMLLRAASEIGKLRPVRVFATVAMGSSRDRTAQIVVWPLNVYPFNAERIAGQTNQVLVRRLCFELGYLVGFDGSWPYGSWSTSVPRIRKALKLKKDELYIQGGHLTEEKLFDNLKAFMDSILNRENERNE